MRIGIDLRFTAASHSGTGAYAEWATLELIKSIGDGEDDIIGFGPAANAPWDNQKCLKWIQVPAESNCRAPHLQYQLMLDSAISATEVDVFFAPTSISPVVIKCPTVITIHDLLFEVHPEFYSPALLRTLQQDIRRSVKSASAIIAISEATRSQLKDIYGVPADQIVVIHQGLREIFRQRPNDDKILAARNSLGICSPYVLHLSNFAPHKNTKFAIDVFARWVEETKTQSHQLVLAGRGPSPGEPTNVERILCERGLEARTKLIGPISDELLPCLYAGADAFLFPSLFEGWGLPPLEAIAMGTPVIASDCGALKEAMADAGYIINLDKPEAWVSALAEILDGHKLSSLKERMIKRSEQLFVPKGAALKKALSEAVSRPIAQIKNTDRSQPVEVDAKKNSISGCTIVRNAVKLRYPLEASLKSYLPICDEVIICYDPTSDDETEKLISTLAKRYQKIRPMPSAWNLSNHTGGTEIAIQSNIAIGHCKGNWVLYVQADEALHEKYHRTILEIASRAENVGVLFDRHSFLHTLDREIGEHFVRGLLRMFRRGIGSIAGDGMTAELSTDPKGKIVSCGIEMFNYSRMGGSSEVIERSKCRDVFYMNSDLDIEANQQNECKQVTRPFEVSSHPGAIREYYVGEYQVKSSIALILLVGENECQNSVSFWWSFRAWPGTVLLIDDMTQDCSGEMLYRNAITIGQISPERIKVIRTPLNGDFAEARNLAHRHVNEEWVLHVAPDELWDSAFLKDLDKLVIQLERDHLQICGMARANFLDGVLINDLPWNRWTADGIRQHRQFQSWPANNLDIQYRLMRRSESWHGRVHEQPTGLSNPSKVIVLAGQAIIHNKTLQRQRRQEEFYRSLGQAKRIPDEP